ncbi:MAG: hypothetical protein ABJC19_08260, partial [Gemmatimonadota bacterium]
LLCPAIAPSCGHAGILAVGWWSGNAARPPTAGPSGASPTPRLRLATPRVGEYGSAMRYPILCAISLAAASMAACQQKPPAAEAVTPPRLEQVLPNLPLPPDGMALTSENSKDAMQFVFTTPASVDSVLAYYRDVLGKPPYRLINEASTNGVTSFYVEQDGPSMWVAVQKNGDAGALVTIAGAATDSARKALPPADSTAKPKPPA